MPELHPGVADSGLCSSRDVVLRFVAQAGRTYVVMPYTRCAQQSVYADCAALFRGMMHACMQALPVLHT